MKKPGTIQRLWTIWGWLEDGSLCLLLLAMVSLACVQIALRTFFSGGFLWAEPLLRYLVLWGGLLGAVVATRENKHIGIDVIMYLAPETIKNRVRLILYLFSCVVSSVLTWAAIVFVKNEAAFGTIPLLGVPSWIWNLIFPISFGLIAFHFLVALVLEFLAMFGFQKSQATRSEQDTTND